MWKQIARYAEAQLRDPALLKFVIPNEVRHLLVAARMHVVK